MRVVQKSAEILVVGNELLNGTTLDSNSFWLSKELNKAGVRIERKTTIRDNLTAISSAFKQAISREPDWLFSIGGLGPTYDDMTVQGLSEALRVQMKLDSEAVGMLKQYYRQRKLRRLSRASLKMAMMPKSALPLLNTVGSAPGVMVVSGRTKIIALPGVPKEMEQIFNSHILPKVKEESEYLIREEWIKIMGLPESRLAPKVLQLFREYKEFLYIKSHPRGFKNGKPVLELQIILEVAIPERTVGNKMLRKVTKIITSYARGLGADVTRLNSVR